MKLASQLIHVAVALDCIIGMHFGGLFRDVNSGPLSPQLPRCDAGGRAATERIQHKVSRVRRSTDYSLKQCRRLLRAPAGVFDTLGREVGEAGRLHNQVRRGLAGVRVCVTLQTSPLALRVDEQMIEDTPVPARVVMLGSAPPYDVIEIVFPTKQGIHRGLEVVQRGIVAV